MNLPKELESLARKKVWVCYPLIWNPKKHNGVGGYDKPPINPRTLWNAYTNDPDTLGTFEEAAARIGQTARVRVKGHDGAVTCKVEGVGIALSGTGLVGLDYDNVANESTRRMTRDAFRIMSTLQSYTELSPSGLGLHTVFYGVIPDNVKRVASGQPDIFGTRKGEFQIFDSGYITITGKTVGGYGLRNGMGEMMELFREFFPVIHETEDPAPAAPSEPARHHATDPADKYTRWLEEAGALSDGDLLERIYKSGGLGQKVKRLFSGDLSDYGNDQSRADQALCTYLYGFTKDRERTKRLFISSDLYREPGRKSGKSKNYLTLTLNKAEHRSLNLTGFIEYTADERREYAKQKQADEAARLYQGLGRLSAAAWVSQVKTPSVV